MSTAASKDDRPHHDSPLLDSELEALVNEALGHAAFCGQAQCKPGHLLLALAKRPWGRALLERMGGDATVLTSELSKFTGLPLRSPTTHMGRARRYLHRKVFNTLRDHEVILDPRALGARDATTRLGDLRARAFLAIQPAELSTRVDVEPSAEFSALIEHVVVESLGAEDEAERIGTAIIAGILGQDGSPAADALRTAGIDEWTDADRAKPTDPLGVASFTSNLSAAARAGELLPTIGREEELEAVIQLLGRRDRNWVLLAGEPGTGKGAVVSALAEVLAKGPRACPDHVVLQVDFDALLAGGGRSDLDARIRRARRELERVDHAIVVLDIDHVASPANPRPDPMELLPDRGRPTNLRFIAKMSHATYETLLRSPAAFDERFDPVVLAPMEPEAAVAVVRMRSEQYERFHQVRYLPAALRHAVELGEQVGGRRLPGSALDVLDHAAAMVKSGASSDERTVRPDDVERALLAMTLGPQSGRGAARASVSSDDLATRLSSHVRGQDQAVRRVCDAVLLHQAGLRTGERPIASFVFAGPSGVGKTELARRLASELGIPLIRFDMSEYREKHSVARLIGAPPGYAGYDRGGLLTSAVRRTPHAVLLLDEVEKSNHDVYHLLLQIMDYGTLTDNAGCAASFRDIILIMTSNIGAAEAARSLRTVGFGPADAPSDRERDEPFRREFPPEFINRLDAKIVFAPLGPEIIAELVDAAVVRLEARLRRRQVELHVSDGARGYLARHGCDPHNGARPLQRLVDNEILTPIAHELVFGEFRRGGVVQIDGSDDVLNISFEPHHA